MDSGARVGQVKRPRWNVARKLGDFPLQLVRVVYDTSRTHWCATCALLRTRSRPWLVLWVTLSITRVKHVCGTLKSVWSSTLWPQVLSRIASSSLLTVLDVHSKRCQGGSWVWPWTWWRLLLLPGNRESHARLCNIIQLVDLYLWCLCKCLSVRSIVFVFFGVPFFWDVVRLLEQRQCHYFYYIE